MTEVGPHLLGRRPSPPDPRDWKLADFLDKPTAPLLTLTPVEALATLLASSQVAPATKTWAKYVTAYLDALPTPAVPTPPAPTGIVSWADAETVLDQGPTPHCVGFAGAQWGNTLPVDDKFVNADGDRIYYACKVVDGEPGAEDGSDSRSLAKVLKAESRLNAYAFAATVAEAIQWILTKGPVLFGTDWTNDMFTPDAAGVIHPTGSVAGGHEFVAVSFDPATNLIGFLNSWGSGWSLNGRFFMHQTEFEGLFANQGEALAAVELP